MALKFVTSNGVSEKKGKKIFAVFAKITQFFETFSD